MISSGKEVWEVGKERRQPTAFADDLRGDLLHDVLAVGGEGNVGDSGLGDTSSQVSFSSILPEEDSSETRT
jgi:hypothetical protein